MTSEMTDSRLFHYSAEPLVLAPTSYLQTPLDGGALWYEKPKGLWVSADDGWEEWCRGENFGGDRLKVKCEITLAPDHRVLSLTRASALDRFTHEFGFAKNLFEDSPFHLKEFGLRRRGIDWSKVAAAYQGLIIAPYQWSRRLHDATTWYYGWDCASGCIWDLSAIAHVGAAIEVAPLVEAEEATEDSEP